MIWSLTRNEFKSTLAIAALFSLRMLALFMILPVLQLYLENYQDSSSLAAGWVIGIYGLTQACFQLPLGYLSDKYGRKPIIMVGLGLFILGSFIAGCSDSILGLLIGRSLQGAGAIGSTLLAFAADLTRPEVRTRAMAIIGMSIGMSFILAMMIAPVITSAFGLKGIFWLTFLLGLMALGWCAYGAPESTKTPYLRSGGQSFVQLLKNGQLWRLNISVLILHAQFSAVFLFLPQLLVNRLHLAENQMWQFYLPVLLFSLFFMMPLVRLADKMHFQKTTMITGIIFLLVAHLALGFYPLTQFAIYATLVVFFAGFNLLEAQLPSWVSGVAPADQKGGSLGIYSTCQFLGIFIGSVVGGWTHHTMGAIGVSLWCVLLLLLWLICVFDLVSPVKLKAQGAKS